MKVAFFDADGTVCHLKTGISAQTREVFEQLHYFEVFNVLCTARSMPFVTDDLRSLGFDAIISSNGACIMKGTTVSDFEIPYETVCRLLNVIQGPHLSPILCGKDHILFDPDLMNRSFDPWFDIIFSHIEGYFFPLRIYNPSFRVNKICVKLREPWLSANEREFLFDRIRSFYSCEIFPGLNRHGDLVEFEITASGRNKGTATAELIQEIRCGGNPVESWAFGDGESDVAMIEQVNHPIAMGNAGESVKKSAEHITFDFQHDGVAAACRTYIISTLQSGPEGTVKKSNNGD